MKYGSIYVIENQINGKLYVGQTTSSLSQRWHSHACEARRGVALTPIYRAISKYGVAAFRVFKISSAASQEELDRLEIFFIRSLNSMVGKWGYNVSLGGGGGRLSDDTKKKMSLSRSGVNHFRFGKKQPPHVVAAIVKANTGRIHTKEEREKRSKSMMGKPVSQQARRKISEAKRGKPMPPHVKALLLAANKGKPSPRRVSVMHVETGEVFSSLREAAMKTGKSIPYVCVSSKKGEVFVRVKQTPPSSIGEANG